MSRMPPFIVDVLEQAPRWVAEGGVPVPWPLSPFHPLPGSAPGLLRSGQALTRQFWQPPCPRVRLPAQRTQTLQGHPVFRARPGSIQPVEKTTWASELPKEEAPALSRGKALSPGTWVSAGISTPGTWFIKRKVISSVDRPAAGWDSNRCFLGV